MADHVLLLCCNYNTTSARFVDVNTTSFYFSIDTFYSPVSGGPVSDGGQGAGDAQHDVGAGGAPGGAEQQRYIYIYNM